MTNDKDKAAETGGAEDVAAQATEGILGPNPFIGLRPQDILGTVGNIGGQAIKQPMLVLEQEAALARDLISVLSGNADISAIARRQTLLGFGVERQPVLPHVPAGLFGMGQRSQQLCREIRSG